MLFSAMVAWLYFASAVAAQTAATASPEVAYLTATSLNVRAGPGAEHPLVAQLARGARVDILEPGEGWARVAGGWVASAYLSAAHEILRKASAYFALAELDR